MLNNARLNLLRSKNKVKIMCFGLLNIFPHLYLTRRCLFEKWSSRNVAREISFCHLLWNSAHKQQRSTCDPCSDKRRSTEGVCPAGPKYSWVLSPSPSRTLTLILLQDKKMRPRCGKARGNFSPLFIKNRPGSLIWNFTSYSQMREAYFCSFIGDKEQSLLWAEYKSQPPIKFILQNRWEQLN